MDASEWIEKHGNELAKWQGGIPLYRWLSRLDGTMSDAWDSCTGSVELITMLEVEKKINSVELCAAFAEYATRYISKMTGCSAIILESIRQCGAKELSLHELTNKVTPSATANQWRLRYEKTEEEGPLKVRQMVGRTLSCAVEKACYLEWYDAFSLILQPSHEWWADNAELAEIIKRHTTDPWKEETDAA